MLASGVDGLISLASLRIVDLPQDYAATVVQRRQ
jgi:hypothetical protein